jgi:hypothetical protein
MRQEGPTWREQGHRERQLPVGQPRVPYVFRLAQPSSNTRHSAHSHMQGHGFHWERHQKIPTYRGHGIFLGQQALHRPNAAWKGIAQHLRSVASGASASRRKALLKEPATPRNALTGSRDGYTAASFSVLPFGERSLMCNTALSSEVLQVSVSGRSRPPFRFAPTPMMPAPHRGDSQPFRRSVASGVTATAATRATESQDSIESMRD